MATELNPLTTARPRPAFVDGEKLHLIDGRWVPSLSGETGESIDPATEEVLVTTAIGDQADVDAAVAVARRTFEDPRWADSSPYDRTAVLNRIAEGLERNAEEFAVLEALDTGVPMSITRYMVKNAIDTFRYYAGWPTKLYGDANPAMPGRVSTTLREPIGVCGQIIPWNSPLDNASWKIAPVIACGNTTVLKPAEQTPLTALRLGELILESGLPDGVVNIVMGDGPRVGAALSSHPDVDKVAFTGSTAVGKEILRASAGNLKRVSLELGGKSPQIVLADADIERAAAGTAAAFANLTGQACIAGTRILVHESIREEFTARLTAHVQARVVGDPFAEGTDTGPLNSARQLERVAGYLELGRQEGATATTGGGTIAGTGYFVQPTVFTDVTNDMRLAREEIFGPVAAVMSFRDEQEAVRVANDTEYGLAAGIWTRDVSAAHRLGRALRAGSVWVNTYAEVDPMYPFGGYKQSGIGKELGRHSIDAYTQSKLMTIAL